MNGWKLPAKAHQVEGTRVSEDGSALQVPFSSSEKGKAFIAAIGPFQDSEGEVNLTAGYEDGSWESEAKTIRLS